MVKFYKKGFTLVEILVALAIVGVVAAITIPQLIVAINKSTTGTALAKGVSQIETGCQSLIAKANSMSTDGVPFTSILDIKESDIVNGGNPATDVYDQLFTSYGSYFGTEVLANQNTYKGNVDSYAAGQSAVSLNNYQAAIIYVDSKSNIYYALSAVAGAPRSTDTQDEIVDHIYIDVNGKAKPNRFGKDIFLYGLTDRCRMFPAGSAMMNNQAHGGTGHALASDACSDNITDGLSCTARVVADGYKVKY